MQLVQDHPVSSRLVRAHISDRMAMSTGLSQPHLCLSSSSVTVRRSCCTYPRGSPCGLMRWLGSEEQRRLSFPPSSLSLIRSPFDKSVRDFTQQSIFLANFLHLLLNILNDLSCYSCAFSALNWRSCSFIVQRFQKSEILLSPFPISIPRHRS